MVNQIDQRRKVPDIYLWLLSEHPKNKNKDSRKFEGTWINLEEKKRQGMYSLISGY